MAQKLQKIYFVATIAVVAASLGYAVADGQEQATETLVERAHRIHRDAVVMDAHADLLPLIQKDVRPPNIDDPGMADQRTDYKGRSAITAIILLNVNN